MRRQSLQLRQCFCGFLVALTIILITNPYLIGDVNQIQQPHQRRQQQRQHVSEQKDRVRHIPAVPKKSAAVCVSCQEPGPRRLVADVDCRRIIEGDENYIKNVSKLMKNKKFKFKSDAEIADVAKNCDKFLRHYDYRNFYVTREELDFPIAYSLLTFKDAIQTELLLRSIYRPHNVYCIHIDKSADQSLHRAMKNIANCLQNVFIASKLEDVIYGDISRLRADINCMSDLMDFHSVQWKYFINLPHQQYPLKTNSEIVKILKIYNGANDVEGITKPSRMFRIRYLKSYRVEKGKLHNTGKAKGPPPHNISVVKGSAYGTFSRAFVNFTLHDKMAKDVLQWCEDVSSPDEYFWATLNFNKKIEAPGGYPAVPDQKPWLSTFAAWGGVHPCHGKFVRGVCVFGLGDLTELVSRKELFVNKFYYYYQPYALQCLEEWHFNNTFSVLPFKTHYYKTDRKSVV